MTRKGPGKSYRTGLSLPQLFDKFPDEQSARAWFEDVRWPNGNRYCPRCLSTNTSAVKGEKPMPYRCSDCRKYFSVKVGSIMESSKISLRKWVLAFYIMATNIRGVSSMKLHRDLGITQKSAWFMAHRIRKVWEEDGSFFTEWSKHRPVERRSGDRRNAHRREAEEQAPFQAHPRRTPESRCSLASRNARLDISGQRSLSLRRRGPYRDSSSLRWTRRP